MVAITLINADNFDSPAAQSAASIHNTKTAVQSSSNASNSNNNNSNNANNRSNLPKATLTPSGKPKEKRRNNEKRKERSRDAARCRRSRETEIFSELAQMLPLKKEDVNQLDKASIMRIAIAYLKIRDVLNMFPNIQQLSDVLNSSQIKDDDCSVNAINSDIDACSQSTLSADEDDLISPISEQILPKQETDAYEDNEFNRMLQETLGGFLLILTSDGDIAYVTDNVSDYLGITKIDILGQPIWEYAHQCDHAELKDLLNVKRNGTIEKVKEEQLPNDGIATDHRDAFVRLKCTLTSRGRSINIKSASYKVIHITGHSILSNKGKSVLVAVGRPIPHPSNIEIPLGSTTFLTKHSLNMNFTYVDDKMLNLLDYKPEDLLDTSLFNCHHGLDSESLMNTFKNVLTKGQGETARYRFLGKYGGYCWLVTQATIVYEKLKPHSVICVNYVISNLEERQEIFTLQQYKEFNKLQVEKLKNNENNNNLKLITNNQTTIEIDQNKCDVAAEGVNVKITQEIETKKQFRVSEIPSVEIEPLIVNKNDTISATISSNSVNNKIINPEQQIKIQINSHIPTTTVTQSIFESKATSPVTAKLTATTTSTATASTTAPIAAAAAAAAAALLLQKNCYPLAAAKTQYVEGKRPKTVTSSIIRAAPIINNIPTTTSTSSVLQLQSPNGVPRAQSVTASVFTPLSQLKSLQTDKTIAAISGQQQQQQPIQQSLQKSLNQDMNKGYLTFAEDATELTMLKEEPDDFTGQLVAPNAVDACIPLDESTPLFGEMLVGLMGSYGSLLPDDINSLDSSVVSEQANKSNNNSALYQQASVAASTESIINPANVNNSSVVVNNSSGNSTNNNNTTNIDPFISYRDESNDTNCSQHLLSPAGVTTTQSPEGSSSLPSLCSPNSLSQEDDFPYYTMNVDDMDDLTMRAPYIPMNEQDDLPLLTSDEFMWYGNNTFTSEDLNMHTKEAETMQKQLQLQQTLNYQEQQSQQQQREQFNQQFSNSLCSSPASTVSSMSPSPLQQQQQQQLQQQSSLQISQQRSQPVFTTDSSELAALLCGTGDGTLSILNDHCLTTTSLANRGVNSASVNSSDGDGAVGGGGGGDGGSSSSSNDGDTNMNCAIGSSGNNIDGRTFNGVREQQQLQQQCLQQLQEQLQQTQHEQQLQQQQLLSNLNINSKKDKFNTTLTTAPILYDTIEDTFENIYEKNSANLDCWNEFLQIKPIENATTSTTTSTATGTAAITSTHQQQLQQRDNLKQEDCKQQLHLHLIQPQQPQQQPPQNIIINAVPLITIQSNNKQLLIPTTQHQQQQQQQQQQQSSNVKLLNSQGAKVTTVKLPPLTNTTTICRIAEHNNKQQQSKQQQQQQNLESLQNYQNNILHQQSHSNNKRHLTNPTTNSQIESKRLKNNAGATIELIQNNNESSIVEKATTTTTSATTATPTKTSTTTTQLLQQLIQTTNKPQKQHTDYKSRSNYNAIKDNRYGAADDGGGDGGGGGRNMIRWSINGNNKLTNRLNTIGQQQKQQQQQQQQRQHHQHQHQHPHQKTIQKEQQSNSVLKNLLISGCDQMKMLKIDPMIDDVGGLKGNISLNSPDSCLVHSLSNSPTQFSPKPISMLRNYHQNPMIGGPGMLASPTLTINNSNCQMAASKLPIITGSVNDVNRDSGIDDINMNGENVCPLKNSFDLKGISDSFSDNNIMLNPVKEYEKSLITDKNELTPFTMLNGQPPPLENTMEFEEDSVINDGNIRSIVANDDNLDKSKHSRSLIDNNNPLMSPFLMDLCSDDYHMNTDEYLKESDIEIVLNEWPTELV